MGEFSGKPGQFEFNGKFYDSLADAENDFINSEPKHKKEVKPIEAESFADLVAKYSLFKEKLNPKADVVYHPCGANDVSPSTVFPDSKVIYVDIDKKSMAALTRAGFDAHVASALNYDPGNVDIMILMNAPIIEDVPCSHVVEGGYVLCNDYLKNATRLHENKQYQLLALIRKTPKDELIFDTDKPSDYWKEIETDDELKNSSADWGADDYELAAEFVEKVTGKRENIVSEYKRLAVLAQAEGHGDYYEFDNEKFYLDGLPRIKGGVDDIFVFQKQKQK